MISVIIPTYNRESTILRCINSVINQTYKDIEVIVVDDKSTDNTAKVVNSINDKRIKFLTLDKNSGACVARNIGVKIAKGDYIAFQDSDDEWLVDKLEKQINYLIKNDLDIVSCKMYQIFDENKTNIFPKNIDLSSNDIYYKNSISTQTILGKKECFINEKFDENLPRFQDWDLVLRLVKKYRVEILDDILVKAYIQENSISKNANKAIKALDIMMNKHSINSKIEGYYLRLIGLYRMQNKMEYKMYFRKAFIKNTFNKEIIFDFILSSLGLDAIHYKFYIKRGRFR